ncbi:contact-dependent growth inhibition system immunity protein [Paenibacillus sp. HWE-109]|uniref:contact-dependent growth inhibition system immunity protein n=1 Tax=Paenibacillus sp. HWE-109 TaxID=1306526 RepID=UPI001EDDCA6D|nr:contact-dependent growth inhibition system immunity protein [Paenibacillus sp. HWE-109]UKS29643.1 contact-dependent growth inhibition system immunity protein [Paenibacillus sp. HWE-109]
MINDYSELTINKIAEIEGFTDEYVVDESSSMSKWFGKILNTKVKHLLDEDVAKLLRQNYHPFYIIPEAIKRIRINPTVGELYDGEMIYSLSQVKSSFWLRFTELKDEVLLLLDELDNYRLVFLNEEEIDVEELNNDFSKLINDLKSTISKV